MWKDWRKPTTKTNDDDEVVVYANYKHTEWQAPCTDKSNAWLTDNYWTQKGSR